MNNKELSKPKTEEIRLRRMEVEAFHIDGYTTAEIAQKIGVDERTIGRDIQENRKERLGILIHGNKGTSRMQDAKEWVRNQLADYIAFMDKSKRVFLEYSKSFKTEASRLRALQCAIEIENKKMETIKSLIFSVREIASGGMLLDEDFEEYE